MAIRANHRPLPSFKYNPRPGHPHVRAVYRASESVLTVFANTRKVRNPKSRKAGRRPKSKINAKKCRSDPAPPSLTGAIQVLLSIETIVPVGCCDCSLLTYAMACLFCLQKRHARLLRHHRQVLAHRAGSRSLWRGRANQRHERAGAFRPMRPP